MFITAEEARQIAKDQVMPLFHKYKEILSKNIKERAEAGKLWASSPSDAIPAEVYELLKTYFEEDGFKVTHPFNNIVIRWEQ